MIKAFFLDFYGTVVHEDGEIIKKITQIIYDTGEVENMSEIDAFWWNDFQNMFTNSYGDCFETQRELEKKSLKHTLIKFGSIADVDRLSNYMFEHWVKPPIFEDSLKFFESSPIPIEISPVLRDLITVIFCYLIFRKPLKTLNLSQVSFPLLFPLCYIVPPVFTNSDKGKYKGKKNL